MTSKLQPLQHDVPLIHAEGMPGGLSGQIPGTPTPYFIQLLQQLLEEKAITDEAAEGALPNLMSENLILGRNDAGDGPVEQLTMTEVLDLIDDTHGAVLYRDADDWVAWAPGSDGDVLTTHGAGADPTWESAAAASGGFTAYNVATAGDAFIDVPLDTDDGYAYEIIINGAPSANATFLMRLSSDNGATFYSGASDYKSQGSGAASSCTLSIAVGSGRSMMNHLILSGMNVVATSRFYLNGTHHGVNSAGSPSTGAIGASPNLIGLLNYNAFRVLCNAGNMNAVTVYVKRLI